MEPYLIRVKKGVNKGFKFQIIPIKLNLWRMVDHIQLCILTTVPGFPFLLLPPATNNIKKQIILN